jgi:hypothetical protein
MHSAKPVEHFVTLFNTAYLPAGLCLYRSLREQAGPFHLWILCMDTRVEACLRELELPGVSLIPIGEVETEALLGIKAGRTLGEYCWTLTPFAPEFVMKRDPSVERVTYVDADLYFFDDPRVLLAELEVGGAHVLITEHAYAPEYDKSARSGIYCVQFIPFRNTPEAREVMHWWQDRCVEWCFARYEDGKHGDQMYLDDWTTRFPGKVHVLRQKERTVAPWNAAHFLDREGALVPVFFHFHSFRVISEKRMRWHWGYRVGVSADRYYQKYFSEMCNALTLIHSRWSMIPALKDTETIKQKIAKIYHLLIGAAKYSEYSLGELKSSVPLA